MTDPTLDWLRSEMEDARERVEKATEGPWEQRPNTAAGKVWVRRSGRFPWTSDVRPIFEVRDSDSRPEAVYDQAPQKEADAAFIAHARTDLPAALSVLDRIGKDLARADMDTLFDALDQLEDAAGPEVVEVLGELRDVAIRDAHREDGDGAP